MLQISEIVKKTEKMFDLFNKHFYHEELTRPAITVSPECHRVSTPYPQTAGMAHTAGAVSMKSGMRITSFTGKSTFAPSTLTVLLQK